jgi:hypothetical protein
LLSDTEIRPRQTVEKFPQEFLIDRDVWLTLFGWQSTCQLASNLLPPPE